MGVDVVIVFSRPLGLAEQTLVCEFKINFCEITRPETISSYAFLRLLVFCLFDRMRMRYDYFFLFFSFLLCGC